MSKRSETINTMWIKMVRVEEYLEFINRNTRDEILRKTQSLKDRLQWVYKDVRQKEGDADMVGGGIYQI
jgi:hypothetical protein